MVPSPRLVLLVFLCSLLSALPAEAQRGQREPMLSERAFGLGGAVVGSAAGPSAAYYNPAGLADTPGTAAGASLSLRTFRSYTLHDGYVSVVGFDDLNDSALLSVPVFVGAVLKFGDRDASDVRQHALAAGMLTRHFLDRELLDDEADAARGALSTLEVVDDQETRWFYASYALRVDPSFSLGVTAALSLYDQEYRESWTQATSPGGGMLGGPGSALTSRDVIIDNSASHLLLRFGASWRPTSWAQIGLTLQTPGVQIGGGGRALFQSVSVNEQGGGDFFRDDNQEVRSDAPVPWQARLGTYLRLDTSFAIAADIGITGSYGSENDPVLPIGRPVPRDGDRPAATYYAGEYASDVSFDAALGGEIWFSREIPLRVGSFVELSGMSPHEDRTEVYTPDRVHRVGGTVGVGVQTDRYDFGLGVGYTHGFGTGLRPVDANVSAYVPTSVTVHEISVYLSGVTGAATQLAMDGYQAVTGSSIDDEPDPSLRPNEDPTPSDISVDLYSTSPDMDDLPSWIREAYQNQAEEEIIEEAAEDAAREVPEQRSALPSPAAPLGS